jgi:hypothetical protein
MLVEYIRYHLHQQQEKGFLTAYHEARRALNSNSCCLELELSRATGPAANYILRIVWSAQRETCRGHTHSARLLRGLSDYLSAAVESEYYEPLVA